MHLNQTAPDYETIKRLVKSQSPTSERIKLTAHTADGHQRRTIYHEGAKYVNF